MYASELRKFWLFYFLKLLFLSIFCRYKWRACRLTCTDKFLSSLTDIFWNVPTKLRKSDHWSRGHMTPLYSHPPSGYANGWGGGGGGSIVLRDRIGDMLWSYKTHGNYPIISDARFLSVRSKISVYSVFVCALFMHNFLHVYLSKLIARSKLTQQMHTKFWLIDVNQSWKSQN